MDSMICAGAGVRTSSNPASLFMCDGRGSIKLELRQTQAYLIAGTNTCRGSVGCSSKKVGEIVEFRGAASAAEEIEKEV